MVDLLQSIGSPPSKVKATISDVMLVSCLLTTSLAVKYVLNGI